VLLVMACWAAGDALARPLGGVLPGSVLGLLILLALLGSGLLPTRLVRSGARLLLADMLLFFVPAVLGVMDHPTLFGLLGLKLLAVIVPGTALVMAATALSVEWAARRMDGHEPG
jgi:holin-like protein